MTEQLSPQDQQSTRSNKESKIGKYEFILRALPAIMAGIFFVFFWKMVVDGSHLDGWRCPPSQTIGQCYAAAWRGSLPEEKKGADGKPLQDFPFNKVPPVFEKQPGTDVNTPAEETAARSLWATTFAVAVVAAMMASYYCLSVFQRQMDIMAGVPVRRSVSLGFLGILVVIGLAGVILESHMEWFGNPIFDVLGKSTLTLVPSSGFARSLSSMVGKEGEWKTAYDVISAIKPLYGIIVFMTIASIVLGAASLTTDVAEVLRKPDEFNTAPKLSDEERAVAAREVAVRMTMLNRLLYISSVALVLAVVAVQALIKWPVSLVKAPLAADMELLGQAALLNWGACMSVLLVVTYATAALWLDWTADRLLTGKTEKERAVEREAYGMTLKLKVEAGKVLVAALPLFASGATSIASTFTGVIQ